MIYKPKFLIEVTRMLVRQGEQGRREQSLALAIQFYYTTTFDELGFSEFWFRVNVLGISKFSSGLEI
jgi:hypothetical protein